MLYPEVEEKKEGVAEEDTAEVEDVYSGGEGGGGG
jgi:hypothetical protein